MANVIGLDETRESNLRQLATYLLSGKLFADFDMFQYAATPTGPTCGAIGCAVGHAPFAGVKMLEGENWKTFSNRALINRRTMEDEYDWCFSHIWQRSDNTPGGAAQRILWLLERGLPADYDEQMHGREPLCYQGPPMEMKQKVIPCPRCGKPCIAEKTKRPESRPFQKGLQGTCLECTVSALFQDCGEQGIGFALRKDFDPASLRLPHIQRQFADVLAAGQCEASLDEIDWEEVIAHWNLPFPGKHESYRERPSSLFYRIERK